MRSASNELRPKGDSNAQGDTETPKTWSNTWAGRRMIPNDSNIWESWVFFLKDLMLSNLMNNVELESRCFQHESISKVRFIMIFHVMR